MSASKQVDAVFNDQQIGANTKSHEVQFLSDEYAMLALGVQRFPLGVTNLNMFDHMADYCVGGRRIAFVPMAQMTDYDAEHGYAMRIKHALVDEGWFKIIMVKNPATNRFIHSYVLTLPGLLLCQNLFDNLLHGDDYPVVRPLSGMALDHYIQYHVNNPYFMDLSQDTDN